MPEGQPASPVTLDATSTPDHVLAEEDTSASGAPAGVVAKPASPPRDPAVGDVLGGRFRLDALLGQGAMGKVFRAFDSMAGETVALKLLTARGPMARVLERFRRELRAARKVTHRGVVRLYDIFEVEGRVALSMEFVEGEDLGQRLKREPLSLPQVLQLANDLVRALAAAHEVGVTHRDIKPANIIMRAANGRAVISDFGLSRLGELAEPAPAGVTPQGDLGLTREGEIVGTPLYMAPEQLEGKPDVGPSADVYALGLVLYEVATGTIPHRSKTLAELMRSRLGGVARPISELRPELPEELCAAIDRCLARAPEDRFPSGIPLRAALVADSGAPDITGKHLLSQALPRRRLPWAAALAGVVLLSLAGLAWRFWSGRLPSGERRVAFRISVLRTGDATLTEVVRRLAERSLRQDPRLRVSGEGVSPNVEVQLRFGREGTGFGVEASVGPMGGRAEALGRVTGPSVASAIERALEVVRGRIAEGRPELPPSAREQARMRALGTESIQAYRHYERSLTRWAATISSDAQGAIAEAELALRHDPAWPHARALRMLEQLGVSERRDPEARGAPRDPAGEALVEAALTATDPAALERTIRSLERHHQANPEDHLLGYVLATAYFNARRSDEQIAVLRRLHEQRPDLQFGANLAQALSDAGRSNEVEPLLTAWLQRVPDSEQAMASRVALELERDRLADAQRFAEQLLFIHGEAPHRQVILCDVLLSAGKTAEARAVADRLVGQDELSRARGRRRLGEIAVLEGRFGAAFDSYRGAVEAGRRFGMEGELAQSFEGLRVVAPLVGRQPEARQTTLEMAKYLDTLHDAPAAAALRYELALSEPGGACPDIDVSAARVPEGPARDLARLHMLRAGAQVACASCREAVQAGMATQEHHLGSLVRFGLCAAREGRLELARDALLQSVRIRTMTSSGGGPFYSVQHSVLARFHLAGVLARMGKPDEARAEYDAFLSRWGHADRPVKEVDDARAALARLVGKER